MDRAQDAVPELFSSLRLNPPSLCLPSQRPSLLPPTLSPSPLPTGARCRSSETPTSPRSPSPVRRRRLPRPILPILRGIPIQGETDPAHRPDAQPTSNPSSCLMSDSAYLTVRAMPAKSTVAQSREENVKSYMRDLTAVIRCSSHSCDFHRIHRGTFESLSNVLDDAATHWCGSGFAKHCTVSFVVE